MKINRSNRFLTALHRPVVAPALTAGILGLSVLPAVSQTLTWDIAPGDGEITGGAGIWESFEHENWTTDGGATNVLWVDHPTSPRSAVFGGSQGGSVTIDAGILVNGITFDAPGYTITGGGISLRGDAPTITANANAVISSVVSAPAGGAAGLVKAGAGVLQLTSESTYGGPTTVQGGRLWVSGTLRNSSSFHAGPGTILELGATNILATGHGVVLPGSKVLSADGGTLLFNSSLNGRIGNVELRNGATWTSNRQISGTWEALLGDVALEEGDGPATVSVTGEGGAVMNGSGGIGLLGVQNFDVQDTTGGAGEDLLVSMVLAPQGWQGGPSGGVRKTGPGVMTLAAVNTYDGPTIVEQGVLRLSGSGSIASSDVTVRDGSILQTDSAGREMKSLTLEDGAILSVAVHEVDPSIFLPGTGIFSATGNVTVRPVFTGTPEAGQSYDIVSASEIADGATYVVDTTAHGETRVTASVSLEDQYLVLTVDSGAAGLVWNNAAGNRIWNRNGHANFDNDGTPDVFKNHDAVTFGDNAAGVVTLEGTLHPSQVVIDSDDDYTFTGSGSLGGGTLVKDGASVLTLENADVLGSGMLVLRGGTLHNGTGAPLVLGGAQTWDGAFSLTGPSLTIENGITLDSPSEVTVEVDELNITGGIGGAALIKKGAGSVALTGAPGAFPELDVEEGSISVLTATSIGTLRIGGGTVPASFAVDGSQNNNRLAGNAQVTIGNLGEFILRGVNALPTLGANGPCDFTVEAGGELVVYSGGSPVIGENGTSHNHVRDLNLNGGSISLRYFGSGWAYSSESFQLNGDVTAGGSVPSTISFGEGATPANAGIALRSTITFDIEDVTGDAAADLIVNAELENSDSGAGALVKEGPGPLLLAGGFAHTHTGPTTVSAGTLAATGSIPGPLVVEGAGTIAPGESAGAFATGDASIDGVYACEIDGSACDSLNVTGNLVLGDGSTLDLSVLAGGAIRSTYVIATWTGDLTGAFGAVNGMPEGYALSYNNAAKRIELKGPGGEGGYGSWAERIADTSRAGFAQDADDDGISNGLEYILGGDPNASDAGILPGLDTSGGEAVFVFYRNNDSLDDTVQAVQYSGDLLSDGWTDIPVHPNPAANVTVEATDDANVSKITVTLTKLVPRMFVRLKAEPVE